MNEPKTPTTPADEAVDETLRGAIRKMVDDDFVFGGVIVAFYHREDGTVGVAHAVGIADMRRLKTCAESLRSIADTIENRAPDAVIPIGPAATKGGTA